MPRPEAGKEVLGVGEIFVEFEDVAGATKGRDALAGRKFGGKAVRATFYPLDLFQVCFISPGCCLQSRCSCCRQGSPVCVLESPC